MLDLYRHYKFYHFFSVCFGLGCGMCSYRPFYSLAMPVFLTVFCMFMFEAVGWCFGLPPHTKRCKGPPFHWRDVLWGFIFALLVEILHLPCYHVYTLSYGSGITMFALRGAKRKYSALWKENASFTETAGNESHNFFTGATGNRGHAFFTGTSGNRGHAFFTGTSGNRGRTYFTGPTGPGGHTSFPGTSRNGSHAYFSNGNKGHAYFTHSQRSRGHASSTGNN